MNNPISTPGAVVTSADITTSATTAPLDVLRYKPACQGNDGIQTLDYGATMLAATCAVVDGHDADLVAGLLLDDLSDDDMDGLRDVASEWTGIDPRGHTAKLLIALQVGEHRGRNWLPTFGPRAVLDLLRERDEALALLRALADPLAWVCSLYGTAHPQGLDELRTEINKVRAHTGAVRALLSRSAKP